MAGRRDDIWTQLNDVTPAANYFDNYQNQFSYRDALSNLNQIFGNEKADINRNTNEDISQQQKNAAQSMASRGITGGSILTDTQKGIASGINRQKYNALSQLGIGQAQDTMNLQNLFNQLNLQETGIKQNQANTIFGQSLNRANALGNYLNQWENMDLKHDQQPGALDDIFSGFQQIAKIPTGKDSNVLSS
jgi:hypothetical protein